MESVYIIVNEGSIVGLARDLDEAENTKECLTNKNIEDTCYSHGRDIDDLTPEEVAEMAFTAGFEGGYFYTHEINIEYARKHLDEEFETPEGDTFTYEEVIELMDDIC